MSMFAQVRRGLWREFRANPWDNVRAQFGPGIAVVAHRPGPDLSASLETTEEH